MEFLESVLQNSVTVKSCMQQNNADLLTLHLSSLIQNFSLFSQVLAHCDNAAQQIVSSILNCFRNLLFECNDFLVRSVEARNVEIRLPSVRQGTVGHPRFDVPEHQVVMLRNCGLSWSQVARDLSITRQTLWNFRKLRNLEDPRPPTIVSNEELTNVINDIKREHPSIGYKYLWASLKARRIFINWKRLITLVRSIDPVGVLSRRRRRLRRRQYRVKGANYLWHMDGNEKLVNWHLYIHGCVDGYSRKIIYLELSVTKRAETVLQFFTRQGVQEHGLPMRVRADHGTENVRVMDFMQSQRSNIQTPFIQGRSVHNTRIERLWAEVNSIVSSKFRQIFFHLENTEVLSQRSIRDLLCLIYVFYPRIQLSLDNFKNSWNQHGLRTARNFSPNQLWLTNLRRLSHEEDIFALRLVPEVLDENLASAPRVFENAIDFSVFELRQEEIDYFCSIAPELVPNPLFDDNQEGMSLYLTLRDHLLTL